MGRPTTEDALLKKLQRQVPIGGAVNDPIFLPNLSGVTTDPRITDILDARYAAVGGSKHVIKDEGGAGLTSRANLNFIGAAVAAADNAGTNATDITITAEPADAAIQTHIAGTGSPHTAAGVGAAAAAHTHALAAGAADITATAIEVNYIDGVTSAIQTQIDGKAASAHTHLLAAGATDVTSSAAEVNVLDGIPAALTAIELGYVDGVTSAIQTQLDAKIPKSVLAAQGDIIYASAAAAPAVLTAGTSGYFLKTQGAGANPAWAAAAAAITGDIILLGSGTGTIVNDSIQNISSFSTAADLGTDGIIVVFISSRRSAGASAAGQVAISGVNNALDIASTAGASTSLLCIIRKSFYNPAAADYMLFAPAGSIVVGSGTLVLNAAETIYINGNPGTTSTHKAAWSAYLLKSGIKTS